MQNIQLNMDRPAFELIRNGQVERWEYDIVSLKLYFEQLEEKHRLIKDDKILPPTEKFLAELASELDRRGLTGCNSDIAHRVYRVVKAQFETMSVDLLKQIQSVIK